RFRTGRRLALVVVPDALAADRSAVPRGRLRTLRASGLSEHVPGDDRQVKSLFLALPPGAGRPALGAVGGVVVVQGGAQEPGRTSGKRILREQGRHRRRSLEQPGTEGEKPPVLLVRAEGREPHLPVEPRLVRRHEARTAAEVSRLPAELVGLPGFAVVAA